MKHTVDYPEFIEKFPTAQMPDGKPGPRFLAAAEGQVGFHSLAAGQAVPLHKHDDSWAVLISGTMDVTVGEERFTANSGESWFIPGGVEHGVTANGKCLMLEVVCEQRFSPMK